MQNLQGIYFIDFCFGFDFFGIAHQGKDIVFIFIIKYSSLTNFGPHVVSLFLYKDFWKMIFWLMLKLGINDRVVIFWKSLVSFRGFFLKIISLDGEILEFQLFFFCLKIFFNVNGKATMWHIEKLATKNFRSLQDWQLKSIFNYQS